MKTISMCLAVGVALACAAGLIGCPPPGDEPDKAELSVLLSAEANVSKAALEAFLKAGEVYMEDVEALYVDVTAVEMIPAGSGAKRAAGRKGQGGAAPVFIRPEAERVNLAALQGEAAVLSLAEVPAGGYDRINLSIENPLLVLKPESEGGDPVSTTDIQLTANSRLFLAQPFTLAKGQQILGLDLNGLNIVEEGAGGYVWTPQLGADLNLTDFPAQAAGAVAEVFADDTFDLLLGDGSALYVDAAPASVWLPDGTQGGLDDLDAGDEVRVEGVMFIDGKLEAAAVRILTQAPPA